MPQDPGLRPHQQPPLPLIQMREDRLELRRQQLPGIRHALPHTTTPGAATRTYGLFIDSSYEASDDALFKARCIHVKEERAELVKHHLDVLWHDYFKPEHLGKYPGLHETFWKATKQASKVKQSLDLGAARELLSMIDTIDEMWKATGGLEKARVNGRPS